MGSEARQFVFHEMVLSWMAFLFWKFRDTLGRKLEILVKRSSSISSFLGWLFQRSIWDDRWCKFMEPEGRPEDCSKHSYLLHTTWGWEDRPADGWFTKLWYFRLGRDPPGGDILPSYRKGKGIEALKSTMTIGSNQYLIPVVLAIVFNFLWPFSENDNRKKIRHFTIKPQLIKHRQALF